ncbi:hypothetical protein GCWU000246_00386 [Jonquetella anthropi E3_33 E1]|nr:hypothetical protein GCWU000246_00386 [Jonquetella anthropi E3_33 E1]
MAVTSLKFILFEFRGYLCKHRLTGKIHRRTVDKAPPDFITVSAPDPTALSQTTHNFVSEFYFFFLTCQMDFLRGDAFLGFIPNFFQVL